jgi:hypothetical protein
MMSTALPESGIITHSPMQVPAARGPLSQEIVRVLSGDAHAEALLEIAQEVVANSPDVVRDEDLQLALFVLYELHYGGISGVDDRWEWNPALIAARTVLEDAFEAALRDRVPVPERPEATSAAVSACLFELTAADTGPSVSRYLARRATDEQAREFLVQRSIYTLKEADPHSWAIPRLSGRAKAALVEIQSDEYGGGRPHRMHSAIFARTVRAAGLDDAYGAYVDQVPAITLAAVNTMTLFGLHRRLRGAVVGHLAAFEMTSSIPSKFYADGFRRLGYDSDATWYFDEHVEADAVHEQIAGRDLAGGLAEADPELLDDILFGAAACLTVEGWAGEHMLTAWSDERTSLLAPIAG